MTLHNIAQPQASRPLSRRTVRLQNDWVSRVKTVFNAPLRSAICDKSYSKKGIPLTYAAWHDVHNCSTSGDRPPKNWLTTRSNAMNPSWPRTSRHQTNYAALSLRRLGIALLAIAGTAMAQTSAPVGTTKPAEYDCDGLEGVALTSCRQLNAAAVGGALVKSTGSANYDCAGMSGASLTTCRDLNGQIAVPAPGANGASGVANGAGSVTNAPVTALPGTSTVTQSAPGNAPAQGAVTPIPQQTSGGTNSITPSGTGSTETTGGTNSIAPSGTGATATTGGSNPISPSGTGVNDATGNQPAGMQVPATTGSLPANSPPRIAPGNGQVSPPTDRIVPMSSATPGAAAVGASGPAASGAAKAGK
jgi:hypothetical protein